MAHKDNPNGKNNKWQFTFEEMQTKLRDELGGGAYDELQVLTTVFPDLPRIVGGDYLTSGSSGAGRIGYKEVKS